MRKFHAFHEPFTDNRADMAKIFYLADTEVFIATYGILQGQLFNRVALYVL